MAANLPVGNRFRSGNKSARIAPSDIYMSTAPADVAPKYVIISPVRDEAEYIAATIRGVVEQTVTPAEWIIVDDGSTDDTAKIIAACARSYPWIRVLHRHDRGKRIPGAGVIEAFYDGYQAVAARDWEFIAKLDGDVGLFPDYFRQCFERFRLDARLGICGGTMSHFHGGVETREAHPLLHVRGPIKLYRRACWEAIGGLITAAGWDTVDEIQANRRGWRTKSFPELKVVHLRPTGAVQGTWHDAVKNGRADYVSGYHPIFMAAKCAARLFRKPYLTVGLGQACGFLSGYVRRMPQVPDRELIRYLRAQQMRRLVGLNSIWG
jgi:glycosyltransferase involved in cell wall biosynthesis